MTIVVRLIQGLLVVAGVVACVSAVIMAGIAHDDASGKCYLVSVPGSSDSVPGPGCGTMPVYQVEAISGAAVAFAGIGMMIGAVAVGRMAPRGARAPKPAAAPYGYGPPPGPQQHQPHQPSGPFPQQGPPPGQQQPPGPAY